MPKVGENPLRESVELWLVHTGHVDYGVSFHPETDSGEAPSSKEGTSSQVSRLVKFDAARRPKLWNVI